jgi:hypothetical protein
MSIFLEIFILIEKKTSAKQSALFDMIMVLFPLSIWICHVWRKKSKTFSYSQLNRSHFSLRSTFFHCFCFSVARILLKWLDVFWKVSLCKFKHKESFWIWKNIKVKIRTKKSKRGLFQVSHYNLWTEKG